MFIDALSKEQAAENRSADLLSDATDAAVGALEDLSNEIAHAEALLGITAEEAGYDSRPDLAIAAMRAAIDRMCGEAA